MRGRIVNNKSIVIAVGFFLIIAIAIVFTSCLNESHDDIERFISIEGDVNKSVTKRNTKPAKNENALPGDSDFEGIALPDFIKESEISGTPKYLYFMSGDGFTVKIDYDGSEKAYMIFSERRGWCIVAPEHPISVNALDLGRIIVVSENSEIGLNIVKSGGDKVIIPMGKILLTPMVIDLKFEGKADIGDGGNTLSSEVYTEQRTLSILDMYEEYNNESFVVVTNAGEKYLTDGNGRFSFYRQKINYIEQSGDEYEDVTEIQF